MYRFHTAVICVTLNSPSSLHEWRRGSGGRRGEGEGEELGEDHLQRRGNLVEGGSGRGEEEGRWGWEGGEWMGWGECSRSHRHR